MTSATVIRRPASADSVVTPASRMPHGTMRSYHDRSQSQFSASPCMVAPRATRAPIAPPCDPGSPRDPGAAAARHPHRRDTELGAGPDHGLFERPHVGDHVDRLAELDDRVGGQLPGPMPGDLAAAVHVDDRRAWIPGRPVGRGRPLACRVHGLMLEQQAAVRNLVGHPPRMDAPLQIPALDVVDRGRAEGQVNKLAHFSQLTRGRSAKAQLAPRPRRQPRGEKRSKGPAARSLPDRKHNKCCDRRG